ncbi:hypothetical protein NPIL_613381 [Nephila pilipes]|uniref:Uncharacterized protein n=1 Tax=Nephila pilipes TaxID=299642 RepID=A0A8X6U222_NEPPI|nr:hypothetical protein NPIL_613381 [Nephila pilipes]
MWRKLLRYNYRTREPIQQTQRNLDSYAPKVKTGNWYVNYGYSEKDYDFQNVHLLDRDVTKSTHETISSDNPNLPKARRYINAIPMKKLITDEFRYQYCRGCGAPGVEMFPDWEPKSPPWLKNRRYNAFA